MLPLRCTPAFSRTLAVTKLKRSHDKGSTCLKSRTVSKGFGELHFYLDGAAEIAQRHAALAYHLRRYTELGRNTISYGAIEGCLIQTFYHDYGLTTYVVCVKFIWEWRYLQINVDFERQIFEKLFYGRFIYSQNFCLLACSLLRGNRRRNIFFQILFWCLTWATNPKSKDSSQF